MGVRRSILPVLSVVFLVMLVPIEAIMPEDPGAAVSVSAPVEEALDGVRSSRIFAELQVLLFQRYPACAAAWWYSSVLRGDGTALFTARCVRWRTASL